MAIKPRRYTGYISKMHISMTAIFLRDTGEFEDNIGGRAFKMIKTV